LTFEAARQSLLARSPAVAEWSLRPTQRLLDRLGHPERHFAAIHVGGTNGKGSVCHLVYRALREAGFRTGLYTSPHLVDVRERFIVNDRPIPPDAFAEWTAAILPVVEETGASFFEATTAIAFADLAARQADIAVVEVGLGGRLDATNVLTPLVAAITHIARDHTEYLGESLAGIAREKAGIAKAGRPLVVGDTDPEVLGEISSVASAAGAEVIVVPPDRDYDGALGLRGPHQRRNAAVAQAVLGALPDSFRVPEPAILRAFAQASIPGRFDQRGKWIFDVAHNPDGVAALLLTLREAKPPRPLHALVGILADKDWRTMLARLRDAADRIWLTNPPSAPADRRWDLAEVAKDAGSRFDVEPDFARGLEKVQAGAKSVLVTGSFHTVGDAMARMPGFAPLG